MTECDTNKAFLNFTYYKDGSLNTQDSWTNLNQDNRHRVITYTYDENGNRASAALPNTVTLGYEYTNRNQLSAVTNGVNGPSYVDYVYGPNGNVTTRTLNNGTSSSFGRDHAQSAL